MKKVRTGKVAKAIDLTTLDHSIEIISKTGIKINKTRFKRSAGLHEKMLNGEPKESLNLNDAYAISEYFDLTSTAHFLDSNKELFESRFHKTICGAEIEKEVDNTTARNFFFEIKAADKLKSAGFILTPSFVSDIDGSCSGAIFYTQCKRCQSFKSLKRRIEDAAGQHKLANIEADARVIAIDLSKIAYRQAKDKMHTRCPTRDEATSIQLDIEKIVTEEYNEFLIKLSRDVSFILFHLRIPYFNPPAAFGIINHFFTVSSRSRSTSARDFLIKSMRPI